MPGFTNPSPPSPRHEALRDYQKVRRLNGWFLCNRGFQAAREYLQIGCGPQIAAGFVNLDYLWVPGVDVVRDLNRPLPFPADRFTGIFTEHRLEHFDDLRLRAVLGEARRVLRPGGRIHIVVPSLEIHAQRYLATRTTTTPGRPTPSTASSIPPRTDDPQPLGQRWPSPHP